MHSTRSWLSAATLILSLTAAFPATAAPAESTAAETIPSHPLFSDRFIFELGGFYARSSTQASLSTAGGGGGVIVDFEDAFGLDERKLTTIGGFTWRMTERWRLDVEYFGLNRSATRTLATDVDWGSGFVAGTTVDASFNFYDTRVSAGYSFFKRRDKELGIGLGLHVAGIKASVADTTGGSAAVGPQQGRKVFTLQTVPAQPEKQRTSDRAAKQAGFSLHAGVCAEVHQRDKLERLCRYITRPAVSEQRIAFTPSGNIRYELKTPYRDGTTHIIFDPLDFIARLVSLVPSPRVNLTRYHGVFAPNSHDRALVTPARRGKGNKKQTHCDEVDDCTLAERHAAMTWAQRLKRVFQIDIETCSQCGGPVRVIASIEDPVVIQKILAHLKKKDEPQEAVQLPDARAPPQGRLFD